MAKAATSRTAFMNRLKKRAKGGWAASRKKEAKRKGERLPDGIINGVAKLAAYKAELDKKGNPYFMIQGVVVEPEDCTGRKATTFHFIRENKNKTVDDKLDELSSDLQLLGIDTEGLDIPDIPKALEEKVAENPFYNFNTWKPDNGDTMVFIQGLVPDDYEPPVDVDVPEGEEGGDPVDPEADSDAWEVGHRVTVDYDGTDYAGEITEVDPDAETAGISFDDGSEDTIAFTELVEEESPEDTETADGWNVDDRVVVDWDGTPYAGAITEIAEDGETVTVAYDDGSEESVAVAELVAEEGDGGEPAEPEDTGGDAPPWEPDKDEVYGYKGSPRGKVEPHVVTTVNKGEETVNLKRERDNKVFKAIPWDKLQDAT